MTAPTVHDDRGKSRLVVGAAGGAEAELVYELEGDRLFLLHTEVPAEFRGRGVGGQLVSAAVVWARNDGLTLVPWCPYARRWLLEHPDVADTVTIDWTAPPPEPHSR